MTLEQLAQELEALKAENERLKAARECENLMATYSYLGSAHRLREYMQLWADREDSCLEMPWGVYDGYSGVCRCYLEDHTDRSAPEALEELEGCIPAAGDAYAALEEKQLAELLNRFLEELPQEKRVAFVLRYYYGISILKIAGQLRCSESRVKSMLHRTRKQLRTYLEQEGIDL